MLPCSRLLFDGSASTGDEKDKKNVDEDGKVRNFPHEQGQWVSTVYATLPGDVEERMIDLVQELACDSVKPVDNLHLSLHRSSIILRYHHIQSVINSMSTTIRKHPHFSTVLNSVDVFSNDEETRHFICACDTSHNTNRTHVLDAVNSTLKQYTEVKEYSSPFVFHFSLMWTATRHSEQVESIVKTLEEELASDPVVFTVTEVTLKIGNQEHKIPLKKALSCT